MQLKTAIKTHPIKSQALVTNLETVKWPIECQLTPKLETTRAKIIAVTTIPKWETRTLLQLLRPEVRLLTLLREAII